MAQLTATRSRDPNTQHGCVLVDASKRVISVGYNGPVQGIDDSQVPLTRPEKYNWFIHAEQSAIIFAQRSLVGCTAYITGFPCATCANMLAQAGISFIKHGKLLARCVDEKMVQDVLKMTALKGIVIEEI